MSRKALNWRGRIMATCLTAIILVILVILKMASWDIMVKLFVIAILLLLAMCMFFSTINYQLIGEETETT
jgi:Mn2+/Fe2+ NRAMP family transporter